MALRQLQTAIFSNLPLRLSPDVGSLRMALPFESVTTSSRDDLSKRARKPYTITKCRESWTEPEHDKFLEAIQLFDRDWKKIEAFVGSKTVIQIRSHAQKYFLKVEKSGTGEHLPPPRPKRKAAHPYPQKASKNVSGVALVTVPFQSSSVEPKYNIKPDSSSAPASFISATAMSSRADNSIQTVNFSQGARGQVIENNCSSSTDRTTRTRFPTKSSIEEHNNLQLRVLPDFGQVYNFIGSVFDPKASNHLKRLEQMDQIDVETVLLLMRNLAINLTSSDFEDHKRVLSSYDCFMEHG
ncbi:protein REVEILLE 6-like isoform X3 [Cucumis melo]|uniref:Protein REVEILLE 6-like isoform X3 n=1 Tax=Cucumis melo TaxID=3656 RepID=A0A1S3AYE0_CUCME|nr:protein REVEILLE 6-like isoform X3 [Cucumis melo]